LYIDLISYQLAEGVTEHHLREVAERIHNEWMKRQPGFLKWEITKGENGTYTDFVYWESQEAAGESEQRMKDIPNAEEWHACYRFDSIKNQKLYPIAGFSN